MIGVLGADSPLGERIVAVLRERGDPVRAATLGSLPGLLAVVAVASDLLSVDAAVAARVPYVDASVEPDFVAEVLARHARAPVPVLPGCGLAGVLPDLVAAIAAEHYGGPVDRIEVHVDDSSRPVIAVDRVLSPLLEQVFIPRHVPGAEVVASLVLPVPHAFRAVAEATGMGPSTFVACEGTDPLNVAARLLSLAARIVARSDQPAGAMAPAEAFDAERFLDTAAGPDLRWSFAFPETGDLSV